MRVDLGVPLPTRAAGGLYVDARPGQQGSWPCRAAWQACTPLSQQARAVHHNRGCRRRFTAPSSRPATRPSNRLAPDCLLPRPLLQVAIPLERAGSCLQEVGNEIYGPSPLYEGFRTPVLLRFTT